MGCNAVDFSLRIDEEIKSKNKKIFIGCIKRECGMQHGPPKRDAL